MLMFIVSLHSTLFLIQKKISKSQKIKIKTNKQQKQQNQYGKKKNTKTKPNSPPTHKHTHKHNVGSLLCCWSTTSGHGARLPAYV